MYFMICWKCGKENSISTPGKSSECEFCKADLRCCKGCRFYSTGSHFDCKENVSEPVTDKERGNFCDFFMAKQTFETTENKSEAAKKAAAALFNDVDIPSSLDKDSSRNVFNSLFGD